MPYRDRTSPNWYISYTAPSGRRIRESARTIDYREAAAIEAQKRLEAQRVKHHGEQPSYTYDQLMVDYLRATTAKKSHNRDLDSARRLQEHFSGMVVADITPQQVSDYKRKRRGDGVVDATIAKELLLLSAAVRYANAEWGWGIPNPTAGRIPQAQKKAPRWLTESEAQSLIGEAGKRSRAPHLLDFIELGLSTGMRRDEMLRLEWRRVDFGTRLIYFDTDDQKGQRPGSIPISDWALSVLKRRQAFRDEHEPRTPWVFCNRKGERIESVKTGFNRAVKDAELSDVTPHTLRHTFASWLVQKGVALREVMDLCRHEDIRTTLRYAHLAPHASRHSLAAIDAIRSGFCQGGEPGEAEKARNLLK